MLRRRPFGSRENAVAAAREEWFALDRNDWLEAFAHHPRIGDMDAIRRKFSPAAAALSVREQEGVSGAPEEVLAALVERNREYEARFGYIFIVCASGKSAEEMLAILERRLLNNPETELAIAAEEHARICELRLTAAE